MDLLRTHRTGGGLGIESRESSRVVCSIRVGMRQSPYLLVAANLQCLDYGAMCQCACSSRAGIGSVHRADGRAVATDSAPCRTSCRSLLPAKGSDGDPDLLAGAMMMIVAAAMVMYRRIVASLNRGSL